ncbi:MAG: hypothetical protein ACUVQ1_08075 [Candidatus Kapaibacteriales bacterium]
MTYCEFIAKVDLPIRKFLVNNFPRVACFLYSYARNYFLNKLINERPISKSISPNWKVQILGLEFRLPLFNSAGMFKNGDGYYLAYHQGAGAFLAGTVTAEPRTGNSKYGIKHPFLPYPRSQSSSNWLGLPNQGYELVAKKISKLQRFPSFPIGISIASNLESEKTLMRLLEVLYAFQQAGVDFIELNESCPNVEHKQSKENLDIDFTKRLEFISQKFLVKRKRNLPIIVKLSVDFPIPSLQKLIDLLVDLKFDGINFGNTSTDYNGVREFVNPKEKKAFDFFVNTFGGGLAGSIIKNRSLELSTKAIEYIKTKNIPYEFHIIRTGGITTSDDFFKSFKEGIVLHQWFSGYFENFARFGHQLYLKFFESSSINFNT